MNPARDLPPPHRWAVPRSWGRPQPAGRSVELRCQDHGLRLSLLAGGICRVQYLPEGETSSDFSWAVVASRHPPGKPLLEEGADGIRVRSPEGAVQVRVEVPEGRLGFLDHKGRDFLETGAGGFSHADQARRLDLVYPDGEKTFGFGEKSGRLDKRGAVLRMWNTDSFLYDRLTDPLYLSIPFWIGLRDGEAYGVLLDNPGPSLFDLGVRDGRTLSAFTWRGPLDFYVIPGPSPREVLDRYTLLTGRPPVPPLWALGFQQCRYSYHAADRLRQLARAFREHGIPCDVLYLDIHHLHGFRSFTWDPERFPDPQGLVEEIHRLGFKLVTISDPGLKAENGYGPHDSGRAGGHLVLNAGGDPVTGQVWPGVCVFPDFTSASARRWWGDLHRNLVACGVDGFWNDMNEPSVFQSPGGTLPPDSRHRGDAGAVDHLQVHNAYGMQMARATWEGLRRLRPGSRPFVLTRAGYAGVQRYAACWSGDNSSTWEDLRLSIPMGLNMAVAGVPLYGADIGGFGGSPSAELFTRWLQAGAFFGLMRVHSCLGTPDREPWSFGPEWEERNRLAIELRYQLLPYLYSLFQEAARNGSPPMRPLWFEWPEEPRLAAREDVFLLGSFLLVAPVLEAGRRWRNVPLPPGHWYTFPGGRLLPRGRREASLEAPLERIPILARGGALVPWQSPRAHSGLPVASDLVVKVFLGGEGSLVLVEDGGDGPADGPGEQRRTPLRLTRKGAQAVLTVGTPEGSHPGIYRCLLFEVHGLRSSPERLRIGPESWLPAADTEPLEKLQKGGWRWESESGLLRLAIPMTRAPVTVELPDLPKQEPFPVLNAAPEDRRHPGQRSRSTLHLEGLDHLVAVDWWEPKPLRLWLRASWRTDSLRFLCEILEPQEALPSTNLQDDGFFLTLAGPPARGGGSVRERFRVAGPGEPRACCRQGGPTWSPVAGARAASWRVGPRVRFLLRLPAAAIGLPALEPGLPLGFDFFVQVSDAHGRRGVVEWVRGFTDPLDPGGRLHLAAP